MSNRPHIIAAKLPSGMNSQPHDNGVTWAPRRAGVHSAAGCGGEKTRRIFDAETRRSIEAQLRKGCSTKLREDRHVTIGSQVSPAQAIVMVLVAVLIGLLLATGGVL